jgi:hypothetical protein
MFWIYLRLNLVTDIMMLNVLTTLEPCIGSLFSTGLYIVKFLLLREYLTGCVCSARNVSEMKNYQISSIRIRILQSYESLKLSCMSSGLKIRHYMGCGILTELV